MLAPKMHSEWRAEHKVLLQDTRKEMDVLQEFIAAQQESGDACSARLMESKRVLDGLLRDLQTLSTQIDSQEQVLETETSNLNITELSVMAVETAHKEAMAACEKETQDAHDRVSQYQSELAELDQIAKPSVRYRHAVTIVTNSTTTKKMTETEEEGEEAEANEEEEAEEEDEEEEEADEEGEAETESFSLISKGNISLQQLAMGKGNSTAFMNGTDKLGNKIASKAKKIKRHNHRKKSHSSSFSKDACLAFLEFQRKHRKVRDPNVTSCDTQRDELQKAFTEAYLEIRELLKGAQEDVEDTTCKDTADAKKAAELVPLVSQREHASQLIESATQAIAALEPVLTLVKSRVDKMNDHIESVLTPECKEAKGVSETLTKIRELILTLEECPGRNDFALKVPEEEKPTEVAEESTEDFGEPDTAS
jgi:hypothetical protein